MNKRKNDKQFEESTTYAEWNDWKTVRFCNRQNKMQGLSEERLMAESATAIFLICISYRSHLGKKKAHPKKAISWYFVFSQVLFILHACQQQHSLSHSQSQLSNDQQGNSSPAWYYIGVDRGDASCIVFEELSRPSIQGQVLG